MTALVYTDRENPRQKKDSRKTLSHSRLEPGTWKSEMFQLQSIPMVVRFNDILPRHVSLNQGFRFSQPCCSRFKFSKIGEQLPTFGRITLLIMIKHSKKSRLLLMCVPQEESCNLPNRQTSRHNNIPED